MIATPLHRRPLLASVLLTALALTLATAPTLAQQPTPEDPSSLALEALIARATTAADSTTAVRARVTTLQQEEQAAAAAANEKTLARAAFVIPDPPEAASPTGAVEPAQTVVTAWQARQEALKALQALVAQHRTLTQTHREKALALLAEVRLLRQALQALEPLIVELKRRHDLGDAGTDAIDAALLERDPAAALEALKATEDAVKAALSRDDAVDAEAETRAAEVTEALTTAAGALHVASAHLEEATERETLRGEVAEQPTGEVVTLLATRLDTWTADNARREEAATALDEARARVKAIDDELAALQAPAPSTNATGETEALRRARQALATAEQTLTYRRARLALFERLSEEVTAVASQIADVEAATTDAFASMVETDVLVRLLRKRADEGEEAAITAVAQLPEVVTAESWSTTLRHLRSLVREVRAEIATWTARKDDVAAKREAVTAAIAETTAVIEEQTLVVSREEQWAIFVRELEALDNAALLERYAAAVRDLEAAGATAEEKRIEAEQAQRAVNSAVTAFDANVDPIVLAATQRRDEFVAWTVQRGLREHLPTPTPAPGSGAPSAGGQGAPVGGSAAPAAATPDSSLASGAQSTSGVASGAGSLTQELIDATRVLRDQTVARRLAHVREAKQLREQIEKALAARIAALRDWQAALEAQLQQARRAWAAARALQNRASAQTLDAAQVPETVAEYARRERVTSLTAQVDGARDTIASVEARLAMTKADAVADQLIAPLEEWQANHAKQLELLLDLQSLEESYATPTAKELSELEMRKRKHKVRVRIEEETGTWEAIVGVFASPETADFDELLREYYQQLLDLERKHDNLGERGELLQRLIGKHEEVKALFEALEEAVAAHVQAAERDLDVAATRVAAVLKPAEAATLIADLKTRTGVVVDPRSLPTLPTPTQNGGAGTNGANGGSDPRADAEALQRATTKLIDSALDEWARVVGYREWRTRIAESRADLGSIDAEIGRLRDVMAALASAQDDLTRQIARMTGNGRDAYNALAADERPADKNRYIFGEIGLLRRERLEKLNWAAASTLIWLVVIPLIAFILIRGVGVLGTRVIRRFTAKDEEGDRERKSREREERARTLFFVFRAAWTIMVIVLALIYMLKAINVDVTPMIASAGILGLAIAFGAQPLVRDFFAGFFILLENQYNLGDVVTINGIEGTIEKITLRLTIMRDLEGIVHYIPNGHIEIVSNQTKAWARCTLDVGVKRAVDADEAAETINRIGRELKEDGTVGKQVMEFEVPGVERFDDEATVFRVHIKVVAGQQWRVAREFRKRVKSAIDVLFIADTPRQHPINTRREGEED